MKPTIIKGISGSDEKIPEETDHETETTGLAGCCLLLDDRVVFHDLSRCPAGLGNLFTPTPLAGYPDRWRGDII
jgi:hypothetical protein